MLAVTAHMADAQTDSLSELPLYKNAVSDDLPTDPNTIKTSSETTDTVAQKIRMLSSYYLSGKYNEALKLSKQIFSKYKLPKNELQYCQKYTISALKDLEYNREADSITKVFLQKNPFYKPTWYDPATFQGALENYYTMPKFSLWLSTGRAQTNIKLDTVYVTATDTLQKTPDYKFNNNFIQIGLEYHPIKWLSVSLAPTLYLCDYTRTIKRHEFATYHYKEKYNVFGLPLRIEAGLYRKREIVVPSVYLGIQTKYFINAEYKSYTDIIGIRSLIPEMESSIDDKNRLNYSIFGGSRLSINIKRLTYFAEITLSRDMKTFNNSNKQYAHNTVAYKDLYIGDAFHITEMHWMLGFKVNLQYKTVAKYGYGYNNK